MTSERSGEQTSEIQLLIAVNPRMLKRRRNAEFWQICCLISLESLLISLYAILLSQQIATTPIQHELDQAALLIADEIGRLSIQDGRFGNVGLIEISEGTHSQLSLNKIQATLRVDAITANRLGLKTMEPLIEHDVIEAAKISRSLARHERAMAIPGGKESFFEIAKGVLQRGHVNGRLVSLKVNLGGFKQSGFKTQMVLPAVLGERDEIYADGENYRAHTNTPIFKGNIYQFYELAQAPVIVQNKERFCEIPEDSPASVVFLEADYEVLDKNNRVKVEKFSSCALAGAPAPKHGAGIFMLSFPQGYYSGISRISDIFDAKTFDSVGGDWYQAVGGDVPGEGRLISVNQNHAVPPHMAAMQSFYDYIFSLGPSLIPANVQAVISQPITLLPNNVDKYPGDYNSGMFKDTGLASFFLKRQPNGKSLRKLFATAFSNQSIDKVTPSFTFPLVVDALGELNLPAEKGFDAARVSEFFDALYKTNMAGIESMHVASSVVSRMQILLQQSTKKIALMKEELTSINKSIDKMRLRPNSATGVERLSKQAELISKSLEKEKSQQLLSELIKNKASAVRGNGRAAAKNSYEIASQMTLFTGKGLCRISASFKGFLLSRRWVFIPHTSAVSEGELYDVGLGDSNENEKHVGGLMDWSSPDFQVIVVPAPFMKVEDGPLDLYLKTQAQHVPVRPLFVMLNSTDLIAGRNPTLYASGVTPFDSRGIASGQRFYLAPQCLKSGSHKEVGWTALVRDLVYSFEEGNGQPVFSFKPRWCLDLGMDAEACPGLSAEFQIRSPIPTLNPEIPGSYVQDPDGGAAVPLYPPMPIDLI